MTAINFTVILFEVIYVAIKHNSVYHFLVFSLLFVILGMCSTCEAYSNCSLTSATPPNEKGKL